jgi:hypothetical protein
MPPWVIRVKGMVFVRAILTVVGVPEIVVCVSKVEVTVAKDEDTAVDMEEVRAQSKHIDVAVGIGFAALSILPLASSLPLDPWLSVDTLTMLATVEDRPIVLGSGVCSGVEIFVA